MPPRHPEPAPVRIEIDADTSMPALLTELRRHVDESVVLAIPDQCPVLLTVAEFRALKDTADRAGVALLLESDTSLRVQLATMFGIQTTGGSRTDSGWRPPDTLLGNPRVYETWVQQDDDPDHPDAKPRHTERDRRLRRHKEDDALEYIDDDADNGIGATAKKIGSAVAIFVVIGLISTLAGWYALPNVRIVAVAKSTTITSQVNYAVAADGASLPSDILFTAPAIASEATVPFEVSVPTTGIDRTPQDTASGEVILRNPTGESITVPAGTVLSIYQGSQYTTDTDVTVSSAANNIAGETTVHVTATTPGTGGNADAGMLTGTVPELGIYYSNRDAEIKGGTDIEVAIVDEADIQALEDKVVNDHTRAAAAGWNSQLPEGQAVVVPSVVTDPPQYVITANPGDRAETISVSGTVHATGLVYDQTIVTEKTTEFFRENLQSQVPEGYRLDPASVHLEEPQPLAPAPDNVQFRIRASATAYAVMDGKGTTSLQKSLAGMSWDNAHEKLDTVPQFASYELSVSPGWWIKRMPKDSGRIEIVIDIPAPAPGAN